MTQTVEWPHVVAGEFDATFLDLPQEILVTAMRHRQKAFSLTRGPGRLVNRFLAVADAQGDPQGLIRKGNERVLRARLADARFFWEEDRRQPLRAHAAGLARITFHERLGSYARKIERMLPLAAAVLPAFERAGLAVDGIAAHEAVRLCKADLTTQMVKAMGSATKWRSRSPAITCRAEPTTRSRPRWRRRWSPSPIVSTRSRGSSCSASCRPGRAILTD
ncbi:MAG: hypothetical protein AUH92_05135 [Acidobacteria bacterium 13_1_40CM_4_69_4]|nr:MAG: hypothetical protein AUH92_05135 [Acidobacteria bacterium 13_1_40CM_4_69_4]